MYKKHGFIIPFYSTVEVTCNPIPISNNSLFGNLEKDNITISDFKSLTDEIYDFDNVISPMERNIKWFFETAECRLVAQDQTGKIKGEKCKKFLVQKL